MKVFIGITDIAGWHLGLYQGLRALEIDAVYGCSPSNHVNFQNVAIQQPWVVKLYQYFSGLDLATPKSAIFRKIITKLLNFASRLPMFLWAIANCDVFVYPFGSRFFHIYELALLKHLNIRVVHIFHGSDTRPPYIDGGYYTEEKMAQPCKVNKWTHWLWRHNQLIQRYSDFIVCSPTTAHFMHRRFVNWQVALGMPFQKPLDIPTPTPQKEGYVRVVHCPSNFRYKGSEIIVEIVDRLISKGLKIDFVIIRGRPHREVLAELSVCDVAIDQMYSDLMFTGFGTEAAHYGCAPVIAGYAKEQVNRCALLNGMPITTFCHPDEMEELLTRMVVDEVFRKRVNDDAHKYITSHWSVTSIAQRFLDLIRGYSIPQWWYEPNLVDYLEGSGAVESHIKKCIQLSISDGGTKALCIDHNLSLRRSFEHYIIDDN